MPAKALARQLGILPQSPSAPEGLTVHELVAQGRYPHQGWLQGWSREDERVVTEALTITNLTMFADRPVDTLSGGQRQRAWIAMALAQQTDILLLDEPTTYLDLAYQMDVLDLLDDLNAQGRTIVMVLHDLNQAARYADTMVALRGGQIVAQGAPDDVMTPDTILQVFGLTAEVVTDPVSGTPMCIPVGRRGAARKGHLAPSVPTHTVSRSVNGAHDPIPTAAGVD
jgi:iron complex transport system ATP-binding protein